MYIELDTDYFDHPRVFMLRRLIGEGADVYPLRMWTWAAKYARNGVLTADVVEMSCRWAGDLGVLLNALEQTGLLLRLEDGTFMIRGWDKWSGKFFAQYERKLERQRESYKGRKGIVERVEVRPAKKPEPEPEGPKEVPFKAAKPRKGAGTDAGLDLTKRLVDLWNEGRPPEQHIRVTDKRRLKVEARLKEKTAEQIVDVVKRLKVSPRHNGQNDLNWRVSGPEWVLESTERLEQWVNGQGRRPTVAPAPRCGVCSDSGKVPVGVDTATRSMIYGPCTACQRREQA